MYDDERWARMTSIKFSNYAISSIGRFMNINTQKFAHPTKGKNGYFYVSAVNDKGKSYNNSIHYYVASMFCFKDDRLGLSVDHKNRDRLDNRADNLRWATRAEQAANRDIKSGNLYGRPVCQYDLQGKLIKKWDKGVEAGAFLNIHSSRISEACKKFKIVAGFQWRYFYEYFPGEVWKIVPYPEYEVLWASSHGRILKVNTGHVTTGSIQNEYLHFSIYDLINNTSRNRRMHRFIASAFFGRHDDLVVNHKDGDTRHNYIDNLEFVTIKQNAIHAVRSGLTSTQRKVLQYNREGKYMTEYVSAAEAARKTGINGGHIGNACRGERKTAGNCQWKYADSVTSNNDILATQLENRRPVIKYGLDGIALNQYDTIAQAGESNNIDPCHIIRACKGQQHTAGKFQWRYVDPTPTQSTTTERKRKVVQCQLNGKTIAEFESLTQAAKETKVPISCICAACKGNQKTAGGFKWKYSDV